MTCPPNSSSLSPSRHSASLIRSHPGILHNGISGSPIVRISGDTVILSPHYLRNHISESIDFYTNYRSISTGDSQKDGSDSIFRLQPLLAISWLPTLPRLPKRPRRSPRKPSLVAGPTFHRLGVILLVHKRPPRLLSDPPKGRPRQAPLPHPLPVLPSEPVRAPALTQRTLRNLRS